MSKEAIKTHFQGKYEQFYSQYFSHLKTAGQRQYKAKCCFHQDTNPSLSINADTGKFYCHGCKSGGDIFDFYANLKGLDIQRDFPKILKGIASDFGIAANPPKEAQGRIIAEYRYTDEQGNLLFECCRKEPKDFIQRRPNRNGGYVYNLKDIRLVPYRLPEIIKADEVIIVEGEKDADTVKALGLTATTNPLGAGKWREEYSEHLQGKDAILIPDNDPQGRTHMEQVAVSLQGKARNVKWLELPDLQNKGDDVSVWLKQFPDKTEAQERLSILIDNAPLWEPKAVNSSQTIKPSDTTLALSEPQDIEERKVIPFPDIISGVAGDFAKVYGAYLEPPEHFFYMAFLTCLGSVLADVARVNTEVWHAPCLYTLLLGESADDRKSTAIHKTTAFFASTFDYFSSCLSVGSAEALQKEFKKRSCNLLVHDEFKSFISKTRIESSVLLAIVNSLFEMSRCESHTKQHDVVIEKAYLSMLAASTIATYEKTWDASYTDIGFSNRLFLVPGSGKRKNPLPVSIPEDDKTYLRKRLKEIVPSTPLDLDITDNALEIFSAWYMNPEREQSVHSKRLDTYAIRFMALLAINDRKTEINEETIRKVINLCDWQLEVRKEYTPIDADNAIAKMEESIRRALVKWGPLKDRELKQRVSANRAGIWFYDRALQNLERSEEIQRDNHTKRWDLLSQ